MEIAILSAYAALLLWVSFSAKTRTPAAFYVSNRQSGAFSVGISIMVSCVGASATIGTIGLAFIAGTPALWWLGAGAIGLVILSLFIARTVRKSGAYTLPHMVETFLGPSARQVIAVVIVVAWSSILAAQFSALISILTSLTGLAPLICLGIGFFLICTHAIGGQAAVMRVDKFQLPIIVITLTVALIWLTGANPTWPASVDFELVNSHFPPKTLLYFLIIIGANYIVCPMLFGRLFSAKDERSAKLGGLIGAAGIMICCALIVAVGLACKGFIPADTPQDAVLATALFEAMPHWLSIVLSLALISAIVSSADSCLVTAATVLSHDLLGKQEVSAGRWCIFALGLVGALVSIWGKGVIGFLLMAYDIFACGVVMPVFIGLLLRSRKIDPRWAKAAVAIGGTFGLTSAITGMPLFSYTGIAVSSLLMLCGTYTPRKDVQPV
jgi:SSS family solute:Na+ symporter